VVKPDVSKVNVNNPYMHTGRVYLPTTVTRPTPTNFNAVIPNPAIMPAKPVITSSTRGRVAEELIAPRNIAPPPITGGNAVLVAKQKEASVALLPATQSMVSPAPPVEPVEAGVPMVVWIVAGGLALAMLFGKKR
jgi:hypothetical protein